MTRGALRHIAKLAVELSEESAKIEDADVMKVRALVARIDGIVFDHRSVFTEPEDRQFLTRK